MDDKDKKARETLIDFITLILAIPTIFIIIAIYVLFDSVVFMAIWNMLVPKVSSIPSINIFQSLAINILIAYNTIRDSKLEGTKEQTSYLRGITSRLLLLIVVWVITLFI